MLPKREFYFNHGYDGIVTAKSLKHAVGIYCNKYFKGEKSRMFKELKKNPEKFNPEWVLTSVCKVRVKRTGKIRALSHNS